MAQYETGAPAVRVCQEHERSRRTHDALADVDDGRVVDHEPVVAWARSLDGELQLPVPR